MESVTVKNFRCFREEQTARMAPLTFLVGENSTGKTSFLALLRALWDVAFREVVPDFREPPYDLGSFGDIVHSRGTDEAQDSDSFEAGFEYRKSRYDAKTTYHESLFFQATFREQQGVSFPVSRSFACNDYWVKIYATEDGGTGVHFGTPEKEWERKISPAFPFLQGDRLIGLIRSLDAVAPSKSSFSEGRPESDESVSRDEMQLIFDSLLPLGFFGYPYAGAPVRSYPKRTYDPIRPSPDPEGEYIPTYLANMSRRNPCGMGKP